MRRTVLLVVVISLLLGGVAWPATYSLRPPDGNTNATKDLQDMDHYSNYVWDFHSDFNDEVVYKATLRFTYMYNNTPTRNDALFVHLLDSPGLPHTGTGSPVYTTAYDGADTVTMDEWVRVDQNASDTLAASDAFGGSPLFVWYNVNDPDAGDVPTVVPVTYATRATLTYDFTAAQLAMLNGYIANDDLFALGFDPDCHYVNAGVDLTLYTTPVPEPGTLILLGSGLAGLAGWGRKRPRK